MLTRKNRKTARERNQRARVEREILEQKYKWPEDFGSDFDPKIQKFLAEKLAEAQERNGDPCQDNERYALKSDPLSVERFEYHASTGCCGSQDFEVVGPDGKTYLLGFNYGH